MFSSNTSQVSSDATYIEDVFSTWLYTETGSAQTITNGIDLAGKGGLVWIKSRSSGSGSHVLFDTNRGSNFLSTNTTSAQTSLSNFITYNSDGFDLSSFLYTTGSNNASWTFRKAPKFFDVVTWTGTFDTNRRISHSLGSSPGCIFVKRTDTTGQWWVYHVSRGRDKYLQLQATNAEGTSTNAWGTSDPTSTDFGFNEQFFTPASGGTYVAYLFAHDAGGFGLSGTDNVISCGSYTGTGAAGNAVTLGYEPQWLMIKKASGATSTNWFVFDVMRGIATGGNDAALYPNITNAEFSLSALDVTATGFSVQATSDSFNTSGETYIYIAIRRGPMKTPTSGTSVFAPYAFTSSGTSPLTVSVGFPTDSFLYRERSIGSSPFDWRIQDRIRGNNPYLETNNTDAEGTWINTNDLFTSGQNNLVIKTNNSVINGNTYPYVYYYFRRAPGFFDEVCYTGTGSARTVAHNLGVAPELMIVKKRSTSTGSDEWMVYAAPLSANGYLWLNDTRAYSATSVAWNNTAPTSSVFTVGTYGGVNGSGETYVAYLFASCPGVSKVGSYTGNGSSQTINMGFTGGARFFLVKRTDSTGDWWVYDSARGIVSAADPALRLNSTAAEVTSADAVDTDSTGLIVNQESTCNINVNGATYIYLAIA